MTIPTSIQQLHRKNDNYSRNSYHNGGSSNNKCYIDTNCRDNFDSYSSAVSIGAITASSSRSLNTITTPAGTMASNYYYYSLSSHLSNKRTDVKSKSTNQYTNNSTKFAQTANKFYVYYCFTSVYNKCECPQ